MGSVRHTSSQCLRGLQQRLLLPMRINQHIVASQADTRRLYADDAADSGKATGAMPERSEEAGFGVKPQTVSQLHPNVHMEGDYSARTHGDHGSAVRIAKIGLCGRQASTPAQMDNQEAVKKVAPQVPAAKGESTRVPDPYTPGGEHSSPQDSDIRNEVNENLTPK